jgi:excisionase family DNA binding protein
MMMEVMFYRAVLSRRGGTMSQTWNGTKKETPDRRTYTVEDVAQILGIGRTSAYLLVKEGHFKIVRIGNAIRISKRSFDEWLDSLEL